MQTKPVLVVLGTRTDPHVDRVVSLIEARGDTDVVIFDFLDGTRFDVYMDEFGQARIVVNGAELLRDYLVWDRTKFLPGTELYLKGDEVNAGYAAKEWRALYLMLSAMNGERVVNSLQAKACQVKPFQQAAAARAGFLVPPTLVSNNKSAVQAFQSEQPLHIIMKSLSSGQIPTSDKSSIPYNVMTMRLAVDDVAAADVAEIGYCPHFFQREIPKSHEYRIMVVGERAVAFRIASQDLKTCEVDWRKGIDFVEYIREDLDAEILQKIRRFMQAMGYFIGSIDLIVDRHGEVWFLECNQDGAWAWLDDLVDGEIVRMVADGLMQRLNDVATGGKRAPSAALARPAQAVPSTV